MNAIVGIQPLQPFAKQPSPARPQVIRPVIKPQQNHLLAALSDEARERLLPHMELYPLPQGTVLEEPGVTTDHIWFPVDCLVSRQCMMEDGACTEISTVGNDGLVGIDLLMGRTTAPTVSIVQVAGSAYRLDGRHAKEELNRHGELLTLMLRYTHALITQVAQTAVCNRHHTLDHQLCRWLLTSLDRLPGNQLQMTQEQISNALGVRRQSVTEAAGRLQKQRIIKYSRGRITILDRARLEELSCECYQVVKHATDRLLRANTGQNQSHQCVRTHHH